MIVLVQGTGVAEAAPNPDGSQSDPNRDFIAQGIGNVASGLFRGQPVGGSVSQTALNLAAGGAQPLGVHLLRAMDAADPGAVLRGRRGDPDHHARRGVDVRRGQLPAAWADRHRAPHGPAVQVAFSATFFATLLLPVPAAVGIGVVLSLLLQLNQEAVDLTVVRLAHGNHGALVEAPAPATLPSREVTLLDVYGSLLFAGARTLQARLPDPAGSELPVVVLRLRGRTTLGATAFIVLADYAERLRSAGGHLFLSGVEADLLDQLRQSHRIDLQDAVTVVVASETILESTQRANEDAEAWLAAHAPSSRR